MSYLLRLRPVLLVALFCAFVTPRSQADVGFQLTLWHSYDSFFPGLDVTATNPAPVTYHRIESPSGLFWRNVGTNNDSNPYFSTNELAGMVSECTNGLWKLYLNREHGSEELYQFKVNITGVDSNLLRTVTVLYPPDGSTGISNQPTIHWTGASNLSTLTVFVDANGTAYQGANLASTITNWVPPSPMPAGSNMTLLVYYRSNQHPAFTFTTPTNGVGTPISNWSAQGDLASYRYTSFTVAGAGGGGSTGHTNLAWYDFENGSIFSSDASGNGNNISSAGSWSGGTGYATNDMFAGGSYAGFFFGAGPLYGFSINPPASLLSPLARSFSVSAWIQTTQVSGSDTDSGTGNVGLVAAFNGGSQWVIPMALTGSKLGFATGGSPNHTLRSTSSINSGAYVHLVVTRDQSTGQKKIYVNGVLEATGTGTTDLLDDPSELNIGASNGQGFNGRMDEIQFYSGVLSDAEVSFLFNNPGASVPDMSGGGGGSPLGNAVDAPALTWTTGGDADWFSQTGEAHDGVDAAQSGALEIGSYGYSYLETEVTGPCSVSFWWQLQDDDDSYYADFYVNGDFYNEIYGSTGGWVEDGPYELGPGTHTLRWEAYDDGTTDPNAAAYLDEVVVIPLDYPEITLNPFSQTNRPEYQVALLAAATNVIAWQWHKVGSGPIPGATGSLYIPTNSGTALVAGNYFAVASNGSGSATTLTATVTFQSAALPPDWSAAFRAPMLAVNFEERRTNYGLALLADGSGHLYAANSFTGTNLFGTNTLISGPGKFGTALMKLTTSGTALWAVGITNLGNGNSYPQSIAPAPGGGAYVSGVFTGTNGLGTNTLVETANGTVYLARVDADGSVLWVHTIGSSNSCFQSYHNLVADPAGNVTIAALVQGAVDLGATNLNVPSQAGLLAQYDAGGSLQWAQLPSGWARYLTYHAGRIYGVMGGGETNHIGGVTNLSDRQWALFALNATNGQGAWVQGLGAPSGQFAIADQPSVCASGSNLFLVGRAGGSSAMFGPLTVTWPGDSGNYFARYDTNGTAQLATTFGSPTTMPWGAVANGSGNVYVGGDFDTYSVFGSNLIAGYHASEIAGGFFSQAFMAKFDSNGSPLWARTAQSPYLASIRDLAIASDGVWTTGFLLGSAAFGTNNVFGTSVIISSELQYLMGGALGKITDGVASPNAITLLSPASNGANFQFSFQSQSPFTHAVQYRTNLVLGTWQTWSNVVGDGGLKNLSVPLSVFGGGGQGYLRVATQ